MKQSVLKQLAYKTLWAHRSVVIPFYLASTFMFSLMFILLTLGYNDYVGNSFRQLPALMFLGAFFAIILTVIIVVYASRFLHQNQLREYGVFHIVGLSKRDLIKVMSYQLGVLFLATWLSSLIFGYLLGNFAFLFLNFLMRSTGTIEMGFEFESQAVLFTSAVVVFTFLCIYLLNVRQLVRKNALNLLKASHQQETPPKNRWFVMIIGLIVLLAGYWLAFNVTSIFDALLRIIVAGCLIILGTYLLFLSLSTIVIQGLKKNKTLYYKKHNFINLSSMLHRLGNNAASLATIALLFTASIFVFSSTVTLYRVMEQTVEYRMAREYEIQFEPKDQQRANLPAFIEQLSQSYSLIDPVYREFYQSVAKYENQSLFSYQDEADLTTSQDQGVYVLAESIDSYNDYFDENEILAHDEVLVSSNTLSEDQMSQLVLNGKSYIGKPTQAKPLTSYGIEAIYIAFPDQKSLDEFLESFDRPMSAESGRINLAASRVSMLSFDGPPEAVDELTNHLDVLMVDTKESISKDLYAVYGGLLFIGIMVGLLVVSGTLLMMYYKQISEGHSDRHQYQIMRQVGLSEEMIEKTVKTQVIWVFALPLLVAILHNLVALKPASVIFRLVGLQDPKLLYICFIICGLVFVVVYYIFYRLTAKAYRHELDKQLNDDVR